MHYYTVCVWYSTCAFIISGQQYTCRTPCVVNTVGVMCSTPFVAHTHFQCLGWVARLYACGCLVLNHLPPPSLFQTPPTPLQAVAAKHAAAAAVLERVITAVSVAWLQDARQPNALVLCAPRHLFPAAVPCYSALARPSRLQAGARSRTAAHTACQQLQKAARQVMRHARPLAAFW